MKIATYNVNAGYCLGMKSINKASTWKPRSVISRFLAFFAELGLKLGALF
jgi:hypothetical protein